MLYEHTVTTNTIMKKRLTMLMALLAMVTTLSAQYEIYTKDGNMYFWEQQQLHVNETGPASAWTLLTSKPVLLSDIKEVVRGYTVMNVLLNCTPAMYDSRLQLKVGETAEYKATINPSNASIKDVTWTSSNPTVASVKNGHVEALSEGSTVISVRANQGGYTVKSYVMVKGSGTVHVTSLAVRPTQMTLYVGDESLITPVVTPQNATVKDVTWKSSNENVATVQDGVVKALAVGSATITAKTVDGGLGKENFKTATCQVTVMKMPTNITSKPTMGVLYPGENTYQVLTAYTPFLLGQQVKIRAFADKNLTSPLTGTYSIVMNGQGTLRTTSTTSDLTVGGSLAIQEPATIHFQQTGGSTTIEENTLFDIGPAVVVATPNGVCVNGNMKNTRNTVRLLFNPAKGLCELANISASISQCYVDGVLAYSYPGRADAFCLDDRQNIMATVAVPSGNNFNACVYGNGKKLLTLMSNQPGVVMPSIWARGGLIVNNNLSNNGQLCTTTVHTQTGRTGKEWVAQGWDFGQQNDQAGKANDISYVQLGYYAKLDNGTCVSAVDWNTQGNATSYDAKNTNTNLYFDGEPIGGMMSARVWSDGAQALFTHYNGRQKEWILGAMNSNHVESSFFTRSFDLEPRMFAQNIYGAWFTAGKRNGEFVVLDGEGNVYFHTAALASKTINDFVLATRLPEAWLVP